MRKPSNINASLFAMRYQEFINKIYVDICSGSINNQIIQGEPDDDSKSVISIITVKVNPNAYVELMMCINFTTEPNA